MRWIVQQGVYSQTNFELLTLNLERLGIHYDICHFRKGSETPEPQIDITEGEKVFVCGGQKMTHYIKAQEWSPGHLVNDNFHHEIWCDNLGEKS